MCASLTFQRLNGLTAAGIASTVIIGSEFHKTNNHILLSDGSGV
jgi:hypothetical protein